MESHSYQLSTYLELPPRTSFPPNPDFTSPRPPPAPLPPLAPPPTPDAAPFPALLPASPAALTTARTISAFGPLRSSSPCLRELAVSVPPSKPALTRPSRKSRNQNAAEARRSENSRRFSSVAPTIPERGFLLKTLPTLDTLECRKNADGAGTIGRQ